MKKITLYIFVVVSFINLISCDEMHMLEIEHYNKQVYLVGSGEEGSKLPREISYTIADTVIFASIGVSGSLAADQNAHVVLEENPSEIEVYNQKYKSITDIQYQPLPASNYEISSYEAIVGKGEISALVPIKINPEGLHCDSLYAIPLTIKSCDVYPVVDSKSIVLLAISTFNDYSNNYNYAGQKDGISFSLLRTATAVDSRTIRIYNSGSEDLKNVDNEGLKIHVNPDNSLSFEGWKNMNIISGSGTYMPDNQQFLMEFVYKDAADSQHTVEASLTVASLEEDE